MDSIQLFIVNLGKYNEGESVGEWFGLPINFETVKETIGLNEVYEEYAIHDYISPFSIGEYESLDELNNIAELMIGLDENEILAVSKLIEYGIVETFEEGLEKHHNGHICFYYNCHNMTDVAEEYVSECGLLDGVSENISRYFDYELLGRDLEIENNFFQIAYNTYILYLE